LDFVVKNKNAIKVSKALTSETRWQILYILRNEYIDVSRLAERLGQTEANISAQIKIMDEAGLIETHYEPGVHGVRKVCYTKIDRIILQIHDGQEDEDLNG